MFTNLLYQFISLKNAAKLIVFEITKTAENMLKNMFSIAISYLTNHQLIT